MTEADLQPGYDAMAQAYDDAFSDAFLTPLEQHVVEAFAEMVRAEAPGRALVDVGCGIGHTAAHLVGLGFEVIAVDPSHGMLGFARKHHPDIDFREGDASLVGIDLGAIGGMVARFSLIHVEPGRLGDLFADWHARLPAGALLLIAGQSRDEPGVEEFDHKVARAWRWHPDCLAELLVDEGFDEVWRTVSRPAPQQRFPEVHLVVRHRARAAR